MIIIKKYTILCLFGLLLFSCTKEDILPNSNDSNHCINTKHEDLNSLNPSCSNSNEITDPNVGDDDEDANTNDNKYNVSSNIKKSKKKSKNIVYNKVNKGKKMLRQYVTKYKM